MVEVVKQVPTRRIIPNRGQHRRHFDEDALRELADSIKARGVLQNLVVRQHPKRRSYFEIIAGERRWRAAQLAGTKSLPCRVIRATDAQAYQMSLLENVQRVDITALEEADGYAALRDRFGMTVPAISAAVGKSEQYVNHKLQLTRLGKAVRRLIEQGLLNPLVGYFIARLEDPEQQARVATQAVQRQLKQQEVNRMVTVILNGDGGEPKQEEMFDVPTLTSREQSRRQHFQRTLDRVTEMLWASWDSDLQQINTKVLRNLVEMDLEKVRNLRKWLGEVEAALDTELQRRNLQLA